MSKEYTIRTRLVFDGEFTVVADNESQAREFIEKHTGLVIGGEIHSTLPDEEVDWSFPCHADKEILDVISEFSISNSD